MVIPLRLILFAKIVNKYSIFHLMFLRNDSSTFIFIGRINKHQPRDTEYLVKNYRDTAYLGKKL